MTSEPPLFSIVIPTRGRPSVRDAVTSVLAQNEQSFELIVVTDGNAELTDPYLADISDPRFSRVSQPTAGVCAARNRGVQETTAAWVTFLDDDDTARPEWLATWTSAIAPGVRIVTANLAFHEGAMTREVSCGLDPTTAKVAASRLLAAGFTVTRELFTAVGGYDEELRHSENLDLGLRLCDYLTAEASECVRHVDRVVADVYVETGRSRVRRYGKANGEAAARLMDRHADRFVKDPGAEVAFLRILSRSRRLERDGRGARRAGFRALRIDWRNPKNWKVAGASLVPGLERRVLGIIDALQGLRRSHGTRA